MAEKKKRSKHRGSVLAGICVFAVSVLVGWLLGRQRAQMDTDGGTLRSLLRLGIMWGVILLHILVHEAGHLVFGLATGYRFVSYRVGSIVLVKGKEGFRLKRYSLPGTAGQCLMEPPEPVDGRIPVMLYNFGGVIMDLVLCLVWLALSIALRGTALGIDAMLALLLGLINAAFNGIPLRLKLLNNDGRNALELSRNPAAMGAFWTQLKINGEETRGVRLKDMPQAWFQLPEGADLADPLVAGQEALRASRLMDEHRFGEAKACIEALLSENSGLVGINRMLLHCDKLYIDWLNDVPACWETEFGAPGFQKFLKKMKNSPTVMQLLYTHAMLKERNPKKAKKLRARFEKRMAAYPYPGTAALGRELMDIVLRKSEGTV